MPESTYLTRESSNDFLGLKSACTMKSQEGSKLNSKNLSVQEGSLEELIKRGSVVTQANNIDITSPKPGSFASERKFLLDPDDLNIQKIWKELNKEPIQEKRERATTAQEGNTRILTLSNTLSEL